MEPHQPMIKQLLIALMILAPMASASTINVNAGMSTATIQGLINSGVTGSDTISFAAGHYNLTAPLSIKCGLTYTGPVIGGRFPNANQTAIIDGSALIASSVPNVNGDFTLQSGAGLASPCTQQTTIQYFNFFHSLTAINVQTSYSNLVIQFNACTSMPGGRAGDTDPVAVTQSVCISWNSGTTTSNTASAVHTSTVDHNQLGDLASCISPINTMASAATACNGSCETDEGACNGMIFNTSIFGLNVTNNHFYHLGEGTHINCPNYGHQSLPCEPPGGARTDNVVIKFNDFDNIHRINWEWQNQQALGADYEFNTEHDWFAPYFGSFGLSMACCYNSINSPGPFLIGSNNVVLFNTNAGSFGGYGYGMEAGGWHAAYDHNLMQATNSPSAGGPAMAWDCGNLQSMSNNTAQGKWGGYFVREDSATNPFPCGSVTQPVQLTGNVSGTTVVPITSVAPTISPTPTGTYSVPITVTLTDPGFTSGPQPLGNHSIFYTTDGSTPTVNSTLYTAPFSVSPGSTVNAIGMYGTGANVLTYPAGFGFLPSAVKSARYSAGTAPTLSGVAITLTGGGSSVQVGQSVQAIATCTYATVPPTDCTHADAFGNVAAGWASSAPSKASVNATGTITGLVAGSTNITVSVSGHAASPFALTVSASAPTLVSVNVNCAASIAIGQHTTCTAQCNYTGQSLDCTTTDANGNIASGYASSAPTVATVSSNVATGVAVGQTFITATAGGIPSGKFQLTVTSNTPPPATINGVSASCSPSFVVVGSTTSCHATCAYSDGTSDDCTSVDPHGNDASFTSSVPADATISATTGILTGVAAGSTNVTASVGALSGFVAVPVTATPATGVLGNNQFDFPGATFPNAINSTYAVSPPIPTTASTCTFYLPTGTYPAGGKYDCGAILAPTPLTQASSWLCHSTYTTLGTAADVGFHTLAINCSLAASTGYWIAVNTNIAGPTGQGFWDCGSSCTGSAPTSGNGTYPCYFISATYGVYTGMATTMGGKCGSPSPQVQASQYLTLNNPVPTFVNANIAPSGLANTLVVGGSLSFTASCNYSDGSSWPCYPGSSPYGDTVTHWASSAPAVMTIGDIGSSHPGVATGITAGFANIQATITGGKLSSQWGVTINLAPAGFSPTSTKVFSR